MRILVVGGNGFIGKPLVRELIQNGHEVAVFHRGADGGQSSSALQIQGDRNQLQDYKTQIQAFAPQVIIDMILSSGKQAQALVAFAQALNARIVAVSSMDVYRAWGILHGTEAGDLEPLPITEDSPVRTSGPVYQPDAVKMLRATFNWLDQDYDKVAVEQAVMNGGMANTVIRLPMVYGPGDPLHRMHSVLKRIADKRPAIILPTDHAAWRGPRGYVENVAHAIALAATSEQSLNRTYHVCEEPSLSDLEWMKKIAGQTGWDGKFVVMPREKAPQHLLLPFNASQHVVATSERIRSELGYEEPIAIDEAIRRTITWEQAHPPAGTNTYQFNYEAEDAALAQNEAA